MTPRTWTDPVHGVVEVAPWEYIQAVSDGLGGGGFSKEERRTIDLMYTERWRPAAVISVIEWRREHE
jgi:hypothetical protein